MVDQKIDQENIDTTHSVENALSALWEKAREASYVISTLRDDKKKLQLRIEELQDEISLIKNELLDRQSQFDELKREHLEVNKDSASVINGHEKQELKTKISSLVMKIDQYLSQ